jgi:hypothetical protein
LPVLRGDKNRLEFGEAMKYVIVNHNDMEVPIIFPDNVPHKAFQHFHPISAGFCRITDSATGIRYDVFGKSDGLHLSGRPEDHSIIRQAFEFEGV